MIMIETGMRPEEVYRMLVKNVSVDGKTYFNPYGKTKTARCRLQLSDGAWKVGARPLETAKNGFLFPSPDGPERRACFVN